MFYRPENKEDFEEPTSPTSVGSIGRLSIAEKEKTIEAELHMDSTLNICSDVVLTERVIELLTSFRIKRDPSLMPSCSDESIVEKEIKKRGSEEFLFWDQIHRYLGMFNTNADNPKARIKILEQVSTVLSEHNKKTHFTYRKNKKIALELKEHITMDSSRAQANSGNPFAPTSFLGLTTTPQLGGRSASMTQPSMPIPQLAPLNPLSPSKSQGTGQIHATPLSNSFGHITEQKTPGSSHKRSSSEIPRLRTGPSSGSPRGRAMRSSSLRNQRGQSSHSNHSRSSSPGLPSPQKPSPGSSNINPRGQVEHFNELDEKEHR